MLAGSAVTQAAAYVQICILDEEGTRLWGGQLLFSSSNSQLPLALADWQGLLRLVLLPKQVSTGVGGQLARLEIWWHVPGHPAERLRPYLHSMEWQSPCLSLSQVFTRGCGPL